MKKLAITVLISFCASSAALAGDGRIEISQADMASPPYEITNSGSYVLTEDLLVTNTGVYGIDVQVDNVTIDLNGFTLQGPGANSEHGLYQASTFRNLTVKNGTLSRWAGMGQYGLYAWGSAGRFKNVTACYNNCGMFTGSGSVLEGCIAASNSAAGSGYGIIAGKGSTLSGCSAYNNFTEVSYGYGISADNGSTLSGCSAYDNSTVGASYGISAGSGSTLSGCSSYDNSAGGAGYGILAGEGSTLSGCSAYGNSAGGTGYGIYADNGSTLSGCSAFANTSGANGAGIYIVYGCSATHCTATDNQYDGIEVEDDCIVLNNTCRGNGNYGAGHGILATGSDNRIEGNNVTDSTGGYGIQAAAGNIVIRNSASGNESGQYNITGGLVGPITNAIIDHPWANFEF